MGQERAETYGWILGGNTSTRKCNPVTIRKIIYTSQADERLEMKENPSILFANKEIATKHNWVSGQSEFASIIYKSKEKLIVFIQEKNFEENELLNYAFASSKGPE